MQFLFCDKGGEKNLFLTGDNFKYIFKVRRHKQKDNILIRNPLNPKILYTYQIEEISKKGAKLILISNIEHFNNLTDLVVGWCVTTQKTIEKILPMLNELNVKELFLIFCDFSQRNIKLDFRRFEMLLKNSSMQSGRVFKLKITILENIAQFLELFPETISIDFVEHELENRLSNSILVGAEGGFSKQERDLIKNLNIRERRLPTKNILKSETAVISAVSRIL